MHRVKFNDDVEPERILLSYYNSISFAFTELCGRSYGGGVLEILPGEVGNILPSSVGELSPTSQADMISIRRTGDCYEL